MQSPRQQQEGAQRSEHCAGMIHRAMKAECPSQPLRIHGTGNECIARRGSQPLADSIEETQCNDNGPYGREGDQGARDIGYAVAANDEPLVAPATIGEPAGDEFEKTRGGFRHSLGESDDDGCRAQGQCQKQRQQGGNHLTGDVIQERDRAQHDDGPREKGLAAMSPGFPPLSAHHRPARRLLGCHGAVPG